MGGVAEDKRRIADAVPWALRGSPLARPTVRLRWVVGHALTFLQAGDKRVWGWLPGGPTGESDLERLMAILSETLM